MGVIGNLKQARETAKQENAQAAEERAKIKRAAVISLDVKLPHDSMGATRYPYIATMLHEAGYEVELITSSFQHWEKKQRELKDYHVGTTDYCVVFINEPSYEKNIDLKRIRAHRSASQHLYNYFAREFDYDVVYCQIPPNDFARTAAEACQNHNVPFIVDVNDLWPEAMRMAFDKPIISDIAFSGFKADAKAVYQAASAVVGTSQEYADRPFKDRKGKPEIPQLVVYVGCDVADFDKGVAEHAAEVEKPEGEFWVTYAGTVGKSYDLLTLVCAASKCLEDGYNDIRVKILGDGPQREELEEAAAKLEGKVDFLGYQEHGVMAAYLSKSNCAVNSLVKGAPQSIPAKIGDYLASGKPMVSTSESPEFCEKVEADGFGVNVVPGDVPALASALEKLHDDALGCARMGKAARKVAEEQFDRPASYKRIVELVQQVDAAAKGEKE